jgi:hypothetical protein
MASREQINYCVSAVINFSASYCGCAFLLNHRFTTDFKDARWIEWFDHLNKRMTNTTSTCILFTKDKRFSHFGYEAEAKYNALMENNKHKEWFFFKRFKTNLYALKVCVPNYTLFYLDLFVLLIFSLYISRCSSENGFP